MQCFIDCLMSQCSYKVVSTQNLVQQSYRMVYIVSFASNNQTLLLEILLLEDIDQRCENDLPSKRKVCKEIACQFGSHVDSLIEVLGFHTHFSIRL